MKQQSTNSIAVRVDQLIMLSKVVRLFVRIQRATIVNDRHETDGEHTLHLQFLAVSYAARYYPQLDIGLVAQYAMVHDFVEVYAGDTPTLLADSHQLMQKEQREADALHQLNDEFEGVWGYLVDLVNRYERQSDQESRFIRSFDKCDPAFSHLQNEGQALRKIGVSDEPSFRAANQVVFKRMQAYAADFKDVLALREDLQNRIAKKAYPTL